MIVPFGPNFVGASSLCLTRSVDVKSSVPLGIYIMLDTVRSGRTTNTVFPPCTSTLSFYIDF